VQKVNRDGEKLAFSIQIPTFDGQIFIFRREKVNKVQTLVVSAVKLTIPGAS
jgi:hypothetical protein